MFSTSLLIQPQISKNFLRLPSFGHITSFKKNNSTFAKDKNKRSGVSKLHPFSSPLCSNIPSTNSFWSGFWGTKTHFLEGIWSTREFQPIFNRNNSPGVMPLRPPLLVRRVSGPLPSAAPHRSNGPPTNWRWRPLKKAGSR